jgi:ABC-type sugar transport system ATPase subunit
MHVHMQDPLTAVESPATSAVVSLAGVSKSFGGSAALTQVDFSIKPGEVHALVGMNGAGKSTLVGVLSGNHSPDSGSVLVDGVEHAGLTPRQARELGIATVPQRRDLIQQLSVAENLMLGAQPTRAGAIDWPELRAAARRALEAIGVNIDVMTRTSELSAAEQTMVEIAREVRRGGRVLILDEPTAALGGAAALEVRKLVKRLRAQGRSVVYISHHLDEILDLADTITVLRDGKLQLVVSNNELEISDLVFAMVGGQVVSERPSEPRVPGEVRLELRDVSVGHVVTDLGLTVAAGEVVAVLGPAGDGQSLLFPLLSGKLRPDSGELTVRSTKVRFGSIRHSLASGLRCISSNRLGHGLVAGLSIDENLLMAKDRNDRRKFVRWSDVRRRALVLRVRFGVVSLNRNPPVGALSGGNQQKVLLAKWLEGAPEICFLEEPTSGVDVSAKADIHQMIDNIAASGTAVLLASSDVHEVLRLADRIIVISAGRVVGCRDAATVTRDELVALTVGEESHD